MEYRVLGSGDVSLMRLMLSVFGRAFEDPLHYESAQPDDAYLSGLLADPKFIAVAALHEGQVIGGLAGYVLQKYEQARSEIYIYDLAVEESFRRRGVATGLIETIRRIAADRGAWVVYVQADIEDTPAVELYSKLGTREEVLHFDFTPKPSC